MVGFLRFGVGEAQSQCDALGLLFTERGRANCAPSRFCHRNQDMLYLPLKRMFPRDDGLFQEDNAAPHKSKIDTFHKRAG